MRGRGTGELLTSDVDGDDVASGPGSVDCVRARRVEEDSGGCKRRPWELIDWRIRTRRGWSCARTEVSKNGKWKSVGRTGNTEGKTHQNQQDHGIFCRAGAGRVDDNESKTRKTSVCKHDRGMALSTPSLWAVIGDGEIPVPEFPKFFETWLKLKPIAKPALRNSFFNTVAAVVAAAMEDQASDMGPENAKDTGKIVAKEYPSKDSDIHHGAMQRRRPENQFTPKTEQHFK
ncbi:hypothetical protein DFH07DRAFT_776816 [Mycena maculata]|uniref:Uncharacterized protein n=1 Tax=Mycena maculata TaxID=230809 RepID=A0AAD7N4H4_9AGAR|nr:hypothetical protein DFH07DRAFT_776816 [Mycena maculata]